jgi:hypothetical protein
MEKNNAQLTVGHLYFSTLFGRVERITKQKTGGVSHRSHGVKTEFSPLASFRRATAQEISAYLVK